MAYEIVIYSKRKNIQYKQQKAHRKINQNSAGESGA